MDRLSEGPNHPGPYVRRHIIPKGMSVKEAASRLGIGRPALSNFLNGRASLSPEMAVRLEKAFGANRQQLLDLQTAFDRQQSGAGARDLTVRAFVPPFLTIKARELEEWAASHIDARTHLPVLLRKLVSSTGQELRRVDFPGYDNAQRKGPDGLVEAGAATPWVPEGTSFWEFGTDKNPGTKAEADYRSRLRSLKPAQRASATFIFVTPRNWPGKLAWEEEKNSANDWQAVRAFDASDLEQWLEQSVPAQIWLAESLARPVGGYETLELAWRRWAHATDPHLTPKLFEPAITAYGAKFRQWLESPSERPFTIAADSRDEALAFLACLFSGGDLRQYGDLAAVFTEPAALRTLVASAVPFIPIVHSPDAQRELGDAYRRLHCVVILPRNAVGTEADVTLSLLGYDALRAALTSIGVPDGEIERLARESGGSPTILRRRLSKNAAIRTPPWAGDDTTARSLVPMALVGAWQAEQEADRELVSRVADSEYEALEEQVARILDTDGSPVWSVGGYRGVVSKIDAIFAIARMVTRPDLDRFFLAAECVLSEADPALDLPEEKRWAAALYGKKRVHSGALREGISETLVILSVHGNHLFQSRLGVDVEGKVVALIRKLLTPLTVEGLLSQDRDLPRHAEAAPDEFLRIIEEDLRHENPVVLGLLKPVDSGAFGASPARTGLLWALECLAWNPQRLPRVSLILARLSQPKINDNWTNKPDNSLRSIFRCWMPQTAASVDDRIKAVRMLRKAFPDVAWLVCLDQIKPGSGVGHYSYRPRWRGDASGAGQVVTLGERRAFAREVLDLLISWPSQDEHTLGDLVESLQGMPEEDQAKVWDLIDGWCRGADEQAKGTLRERIRRFAFTRPARHRQLEDATRERARMAYDSLRPSDPVTRHKWLFVDQWVQESVDEIEADHLDYQAREERIDALRREAMAEIWADRGFNGVEELLHHGDAALTIGQYVASCLDEIESQADFVRQCLSLGGHLVGKAERCLQGFLLAIGDDARSSVLRGDAESLPVDARTRLLTCAPFNASTWRLLDDYDEDLRRAYWKRVSPSWGRHTPAELIELIDRLLEARRPRAAFHAVHMDFESVETSRLKALLHNVGTVGSEPLPQFQLDRYYLAQGLSSLDGRPGVTRDEMAQLEFLFIGALDDSEHGIPNLEHQIADSPAVFVQAVALAFKRNDGGEDPPEWTIEDPGQRDAAASAAYRLLNQLKKIPGTDGNGRVDAGALVAWLSEVRRLCRDHARAEVGDSCLGQLLANAPHGENGVWPSEAVCEAMEAVASSEIATGFQVGVHNSRGAVFRGEGGDQERGLAAQYRAWADQLRFDYPYVGGVLDDIAVSYEREATWHDSEATIRRRLHD